MLVQAMAAMQRGAALTPWQYETPDLGPYDCILKVKACGLCHSDLNVIDGAFDPTYPVVPGHEVVGEVIEKGAMVRHLKIGDRVGVGWQRSSCLGCRDCLVGHENLCADHRTVITGGYGGFGDYLFMDGGFCFRLPSGIATEAAGPLLCGGVTVYAGLRNAGMSSGQEIGVLGVGGLGHLAIQFAAKLGNQVTAFTTSPDKADLAVRLGAQAAVVTSRDRLAVPRPLDILVITAPAKLDWNQYLTLLGSNGTMVFLAILAEPLSINPLLLLTKQRRVMGSVIGGRRTVMETLDLADRYGVAPMIETFPLAEVNTAIAKVRDNTIRFRAVLLM
jgi:uncharacterized zinc-type alcohol dehydrogenase-like protein